MNRTIFYIGIFLFFPAILFAQERQQQFTLQQCLLEAVKHFPTQKQLLLNQNRHLLQENNIKKNYLPQLNLNGQASYQSDVTKVPIPPIPNFKMPVISKDWYKINFDLDQIIWDGGITKSKQQLETVDYKISDQQVKIKTFALKKQVNILYFNILFLQANLDALHVLIKDLNARIKDAETALKNGILLQSDVDVLKVNKKLAEQQIIEKQEDQKGLIASLNQFTRLNITSAKELATPEITLADYTFVNNRPEYQLLNLQKAKFSALEKMTTTKRMPVFKLFGQAGYGRPGYDMLNDNFDTYYMVGVRLHWNIFDWNRMKHEKQILNIQSD
ncbi:MAG TPA: TolC family protein, partial [Bacteroidetes bacterium]|nr:TolC family protein [Bacteroidota bacterium]